MNTISAELFPPKRASEDNRQYAYRVLQSAVIRFDFGPGTRLSESELARLLEVSRTPVHDALERLEREHLLESAPSRGFTVRTLNKQRILDGIWVFNIFSTEIIHHFYLNRIPKEEIKILLYLTDTANKALDTNDQNRFLRSLKNLFLQLYSAGSDYRQLYSALRLSLSDVQRLCVLVAENKEYARKLTGELEHIINCLTEKDDDGACAALNRFCSFLTESIEPVQTAHPEYFE